MGAEEQQGGCSDVNLNEWFKWRGQLDQEVAVHCQRLKQLDDECRECRSALNGKFDKIKEAVDGVRGDFTRQIGALNDRLTDSRIKIASILAVGAVTATVISTLAAVVLQHILGG